MNPFINQGARWVESHVVVVRDISRFARSSFQLGQTLYAEYDILSQSPPLRDCECADLEEAVERGMVNECMYIYDMAVRKNEGK